MGMRGERRTKRSIPQGARQRLDPKGLRPRILRVFVLFGGRHARHLRRSHPDLGMFHEPRSREKVAHFSCPTAETAGKVSPATLRAKPGRKLARLMGLGARGHPSKGSTAVGLRRGGRCPSCRLLRMRAADDGDRAAGRMPRGDGNRDPHASRSAHRSRRRKVETTARARKWVRSWPSERRAFSNHLRAAPPPS